MKLIRLTMISLFFLFNNTIILIAQNVGIGTTTPSEKLEINGAIKLGNSIQQNDGTIKYDGTEFSARENGQWKSINQGVSSGTVISPLEKSDSIENLGYTYLGHYQYDNVIILDGSDKWAVDTNTNEPVNSAGQLVLWGAGKCMFGRE